MKVEFEGFCLKIIRIFHANSLEIDLETITKFIYIIICFKASLIVYQQSVVNYLKSMAKFEHSQLFHYKMKKILF